MVIEYVSPLKDLASIL